MKFDIEDTGVVRRVELCDIRAVVQFTGWKTSKGLLFHLRTPITAEAIFGNSSEEDIQYIALFPFNSMEPLVPTLACNSYGIYVSVPAVGADPLTGPYKYLARGTLRLARAERGFDAAGLKETTIELIR